MEDDLKPDDIGRLRRYFENAEDTTRDARLLSERDRDYYDGWQLTNNEIQELKRRGQPPVVINRIKPKVDWLRGLEAQRRTDPRAFPRTPQHEQDAESATDAIKYVCDAEDFDKIASDVFENMVVESFGGVEVTHEEGPRGIDIKLTQLPWDRLFYDPHSRRADFGDARYLGYVIWMDKDQAKNRWPDAAEGLDQTVAEQGETYDDRPDRFRWADPKRNRVRLVQMWYKDAGVWRWCIFSGDVKMDSGQSPYVDGDGRSMCPIIMQSTYVDRENQRYGVVRAMIDVQDEINRRRSKALHLLTMRQTWGEKGAVDSVAEAKRQMARPDGHVEVQPGMKFEILQNQDLTAGQFSLLQEAKGEIDNMAAPGVLAGDSGESASGRAVLARQQGAMVELAPVFDRYQGWKKRVYEAIWARVRQFWTEEKWIRVTDDERNVRFVGLNRTVTLGEQLQQMPEEEAMMMARQMMLRPDDPRLGMPVSVENQVSEIDVDIILDEVPDAVTLEGETFEAVMNLATSGMVPVPPELLIEVMPGLRKDRKDKLLESIQAQQQAQAEGQQQTMQMEMQKLQAEIQKLQSEAAENMADAQAAGMGAQADLMQAQADYVQAGYV